MNTRSMSILTLPRVIVVRILDLLSVTGINNRNAFRMPYFAACFVVFHFEQEKKIYFY